MQRFAIATAIACAIVALAGCSVRTSDARSSRLLDATWPIFDTGTTASLRGVCGVDRRIAWASGSAGTVLRTVDGGSRWQTVSVPDAESLDFRCIHAFDAQAAVVLSAGSPARLYRTTDGGRQWTLVYEDTRPEIFFDALQFDQAGFGIAFGDPIDGQIQLITSSDFGSTWLRRDVYTSPAVAPGEAGFAASNSAMALASDRILIGLGGESPTRRARVARADRYGRQWEIIETPLAASKSAGIFSIAFVDANTAVAVGGDYLQPEYAQSHWAVSEDGGRTWRQPEHTGPRGYSSCIAAFPALGPDVLLAVGPYGLDISADGGRRWVGADDTPWHALDTTPDGNAVWMAGADGRVGVYRVP